MIMTLFFVVEKRTDNRRGKGCEFTYIHSNYEINDDFVLRNWVQDINWMVQDVNRRL